MDDKQLKEAMQKEWNVPGVRCSHHYTRWTTHIKYGYGSKTGLFWHHGRRAAKVTGARKTK